MGRGCSLPLGLAPSLGCQHLLLAASPGLGACLCSYGGEVILFPGAIKPLWLPLFPPQAPPSEVLGTEWSQ